MNLPHLSTIRGCYGLESTYKLIKWWLWVPSKLLPRITFLLCNCCRDNLSVPRCPKGGTLGDHRNFIVSALEVFDPQCSEFYLSMFLSSPQIIGASRQMFGVWFWMEWKIMILLLHKNPGRVSMGSFNVVVHGAIAYPSLPPCGWETALYLPHLWPVGGAVAASSARAR